jgi:hypothetical protein
VDNFEMPGPEGLFKLPRTPAGCRHEGGQQDLLSRRTISRQVVGALLVPREASWTHLQVVLQTV